MKSKTCETCTAFVANVPGEDGVMTGECRDQSPQFITSWVSPQGAGWQAGWPPTRADRWCRKHETKINLEAIDGGAK